VRQFPTGVGQNFNEVPGSSVSVLAATHTDPVIAWPVLIVLKAVPVPPVTLPVSVTRLVVPFRHLPRPFAGPNLTFPFVVPCVPAHLIVMFSVPVVAPDELKVPPPVPPVAAAGVQADNVAVSLVPTVFVANFLHAPGWVAADAGMASGTATNDSDAAAMTNVRTRTETLIRLPFNL